MIRFVMATILTAMSALPAAQHLIEGNAQSPVRVIVYEDLECPDCAEFRAEMDAKLLPRFSAKVCFEHRDFPLAKHPWARKAAIAARFFEETKPGLGLTYRKYSFAHIAETTPENFNDHLSKFAKDHGVYGAKAVAALSDPRLAAQVEEDYQDGVARGIAHTPTVLVNGQAFVETFSIEDVAKAIDAELAATK